MTPATMVDALKDSLREACSLDDLTERLGRYMSKDACEEVLVMMCHICKVYQLCRYLAEFKSGIERKEAAESTMNAYKAAQDIALADLAPTHPIGLVLRSTSLCSTMRSFLGWASFSRVALNEESGSAIKGRRPLPHDPPPVKSQQVEQHGNSKNLVQVWFVGYLLACPAMLHCPRLPLCYAMLRHKHVFLLCHFLCCVHLI